MKKEEQLSAGEIAAKRIMEMPLHPNYKPVNSLPIPLKRGVLVRKPSVKDTVIQPIVSEGGIILQNDTQAAIDTKEGIICAVGPECSKFLRIGLKCQFNSYVDTYFYHEGVTYYKMDENDVYFIIESPDTVVNNGVKSVKVLKKEQKIIHQEAVFKKEAIRDANEKDKRLDKTKGKIRKVK